MTPEQKKIVRDSFSEHSEKSDKIANDFYDALFEIAPEVKPLFKSSMDEQKRKLMVSLQMVVMSFDGSSGMQESIENMALRHVAYGVKEEHYVPVGQALIMALEKTMGNAFTPEVKEAWVAAYKMLSETMIDAVRNSS